MTRCFNKPIQVNFCALVILYACNGMYVGRVDALENKIEKQENSYKITNQLKEHRKVPASQCVGDKSRCDALKRTLERRNERVRKGCTQNPESCKRRKEKRVNQRLNAVRICAQQPERCYKGEKSVLQRRSMLNAYIEENAVSDSSEKSSNH